jgi:Ras-related protein Rab-8A
MSFNMSSCENLLQETSIKDISFDDLNNRLETLKAEYERLACEKESQMAAEDTSFELLRCPITTFPIRNPVILSVDGSSYEKAALLAYVEHAEANGGGLKSPNNRAIFAKSDIVPNRALAQLLRNDFPILRQIDSIESELKRQESDADAERSLLAMSVERHGQADITEAADPSLLTRTVNLEDLRQRSVINQIAPEYSISFGRNTISPPEQTQQLKFLMLGACVKTQLMLNINDSQLRRSFISTMGIDFKNFEVPVDDTLYKVQIWDTAGQMRFRDIVASYFRGVKGVCLVFDCSCERSFESIDLFATMTAQHESMQGVEIPKIMIGINKLDFERGNVVTVHQIQAKARELGVRYLEYAYSEDIQSSSLGIFSSFVEDIHRSRVEQGREDEYRDVVAPGCLIS